jgi:DNA-binding transcriptional ArsR family regulator
MMSEQTNDEALAARASTPDELRAAYYGDDRDGVLQEAGASVLERLLTPEARVRILDQLLQNPATAMSVSQIVSGTDMSPSTFHRHREALQDLGVLLEDEKVGNAQTYRLHVDHPVVQLLVMLSAVTTWGSTQQLLADEWITDGSSDETPDLAALLADRGIEDDLPEGDT